MMLGSGTHAQVGHYIVMPMYGMSLKAMLMQQQREFSQSTVALIGLYIVSK